MLWFTLFATFWISVTGKIRGLHPNLEPRYLEENGLFKCLDGSKSIPYIQVNDDYCDCIDGSDEPGTSACEKGIFYCANAPHSPKVISSSKVDDGICDCCDGTDEKGSCKNTCEDLMEKFTRETETRKKSIENGKNIAAEYVKNSILTILENQKRDKSFKETKLEELKKTESSIKEQINAIKSQIESMTLNATSDTSSVSATIEPTRDEEPNLGKKEEIMANFDLFDKNNDGILEKIELWDSKAISSPYVDDVKEWVKDKTIDRVEFERLWRKDILGEKQAEISSTMQPDPHDTESQSSDSVDAPVEFEEQAERDQSESLLNNTSTEPPVVESEELIQLRKELDKLQANESDLKHEIRKWEDELRNLEQLEKSDLKKDKVFMMIYDKCFEYTSAEFVYSFCGFQQIKQNMRSSSEHISGVLLGKWARWEGTVMVFEGGQHCWNGPSRSAKVRVTCAETTELISAKEPSRCMYEFALQTPAACYDPEFEEPYEQNNGIPRLHDEL